jgi:hypothetical protein
MSSQVTEPNMGLLAPSVGLQTGPLYALQLNADLFTIGAHDHSSGKGVAVNPAGLNINSDLSFLGNNATQIKAAIFTPQGAAIANSGIYQGCLYVAGKELYYNDTAGNQVAITNNGSVNAGAGSITGLPTGTASAAYSSGAQTFTFQSATSTPANLDAGSVIFRNLTASSKGVTVNAPSPLAANYALNLFTALPGVQNFVTLDNIGNLAAPIAFSKGITRANLAVVGQQASSSSGFFSTSSTTFVNVTNLSVTLTTTGRPVMLMFQPDGSVNSASLGFVGTYGSTVSFQLLRDGTAINTSSFNWYDGAVSTIVNFYVPPGGLNYLDTGASSGSHTYQLQVKTTSNTANAIWIVMVAYEL